MSTAVATKTHYTPEDLLAIPDGKSYELVRGQLVERNMGAESRQVGGRLYSHLDLLFEDDELSGEDVMPGFRSPIREILPPREQVENAQPPANRPSGPQ